MRILRYFQILFIFAILSAPVWAIDYDVDPTFVPQVTVTDSGGVNIYDVYIQPDGKILTVGSFSRLNGTPSRFIGRLNADGTTDTTFTSPFSLPASGFGQAVSIKVLANGKYLINGSFRVGSQYSSYAVLNTDGTVDPSIVLGTLSPEGNVRLNGIAEQLPDGKFLGCGSRNGGEPFTLVHRLNADATEDPTFNVNFAIGVCQSLKLQPDGKILMSGFLLNKQGVQIKSFHRLNADGSLDPTFDPPLPAVSGNFYHLPDGKMLAILAVSGGNIIKRLNADGTLDIDIPQCGGTVLHAFSDGRLLISGCKRWVGGDTWDFAIVNSDGTLDTSLAWTDFDLGVAGFREDANGNLIGYGRFSSVDNYGRYNMARLKLDTAPAKAPYDFDGDGKSDFAVFRPSDGTWYIYQSTGGPRYFRWGISTDKPAATHLDTDGKTDIAVLRDGVLHAYSDASGYRAYAFNIANGKPLFGDFDGDDIEDIVVRGTFNGNLRWVKRTSFGMFYQSPQTLNNLAGEGIDDKPVLADYDGDGRVEQAFFRDGTWSIAPTSSGPARSVQWGAAGDIPVPGDYDGDRKADLAVFRPSTGTWWIFNSSTGVFAMQFGTNGDIPVPADYDGDGKTDIAVFRNGVWWQYLSATGTVAAANWGVAGDLPIPAQSQ